MAVLFAEGFTGAPVPTSNTTWGWGPANGVYSLGWTLSAFVAGTSGVSATDGAIIAAIEPDPVFGERRQLRLAKANASYTNTLIQQAIKPLPRASEFQKIIIGMTATLDFTSSQNKNRWLYIGNQVGVPNSAYTAAQMNNLDGALALIRFTGDTIGSTGGTGLFPQNQNGPSIDLPNLAVGTFAHIEIMIEKDVPRTRVYIDGTLVSDAQRVPTTFSGFSVGQWIQTGAGGVANAKYSNIYVLGMDANHTARLGPAARILEVAPPGDMDVQWKRPDGYATNAEVMGQMFNVINPAYLAASKVGDYDVYSAPSAVAANAVQVFGAGIKVNAMTMAAGTHTIKPVVKTATGVHEVGSESTLLLGTLTPIFADTSVNPDTNAVWTPSAVNVAGFGVKLKS